MQKRSEHDYYATEPKAVELLLDLEEFKGLIWECACGEGHLSEAMKAKGYEVYSSDLIDRNYGDAQIDFINDTHPFFEGNIITNPPYKYADKFIVKSLEILQEGKKLALFLPSRYLEGKARKKIYEQYPPKKIYISSGRLKCAANGDFKAMKGSAVAYAWLVWEKGFAGEPTVKWFN